MALFPLFLSAEADSTTLAVLMAHVSFISLLFQTGIVFVGNAVTLRLSKWRYIRSLATRFAGLAFIGFGAKLVLDSR
jgi:threonine/homoserine/homoserine lactone efflux protein